MTGNHRTWDIPRDTGGSAESELGGNVDVGRVLVLAEQGDVEDNRERGSVSGENAQLAGAAGEGLGGLAGQKLASARGKENFAINLLGTLLQLAIMAALLHQIEQLLRQSRVGLLSRGMESQRDPRPPKRKIEGLTGQAASLASAMLLIVGIRAERVVRSWAWALTSAVFRLMAAVVLFEGSLRWLASRVRWLLLRACKRASLACFQLLFFDFLRNRIFRQAIFAVYPKICR